MHGDGDFPAAPEISVEYKYIPVSVLFILVPSKLRHIEHL